MYALYFKIFDLKGSVRSRYVQMSRSEKENNVLLDENLLESKLHHHIAYDLSYAIVIVEEWKRALTPDSCLLVNGEI